MAHQLHHDTTKFEQKKFPVVLICDQVNSPANIGSLFRIADSFGISQIYFCGEDITVVSKRMLRTARSTHHHVAHQHKEEITEVITSLKDDGYSIVALEITEDSIPCSDYDINSDQKIALIIGEENYGVSEAALKLSDQTVHIDMYGNNSSMNVAVATGIALYEITNQLLPSARLDR